jgi:hypothetical protein
MELYILNVSRRWGWVLNATPQMITPGKGHSTQQTEGWVGPKVWSGLAWTAGNSLSPPNFEPQTFHHDASRMCYYTCDNSRVPWVAVPKKRPKYFKVTTDFVSHTFAPISLIFLLATNTALDNGTERLLTELS